MSDRHEQFAGKNAALGRIWGGESKEKPKVASATIPKVGKCEKCGLEKPLTSYRSNQHNRTEGTASYGVVYEMLCEACKPAVKPKKEAPQMSDKAIKAMLRGARKAL